VSCRRRAVGQVVAALSTAGGPVSPGPWGPAADRTPRGRVFPSRCGPSHSPALGACAVCRWLSGRLARIAVITPVISESGCPGPRWAPRTRVGVTLRLLPLRGGKLVGCSDSDRPNWADRSSTNCASACPPAGHGVGFCACVPGYPGQAGPDGRPGPQLKRRRSSRDCAAKGQPGDLRRCSSPGLQRSDHGRSALKKTLKQPLTHIMRARSNYRSDSHSFSTFRSKRCFTGAERQHVLKACGSPPKGPTLLPVTR